MKNKIWIAGLCAGTLVFGAAGCSSETTKKDETAPSEIQKENKNNEQSDKPADTKVQMITDEGIYTRKMDDQTIEIKTASNGTLLLQLTDASKEAIKTIKTGSTVSISFQAENHQYTAETIKLIKAPIAQPSKPKPRPEQTVLPKTKTLIVNVEGEQDKRTAKLAESDQGYYFYKFDHFDFTAEEPGRDLLYSQMDEEYFVRIEPLDDAASLADIKSLGIKELEEIGKPDEVKGSDVDSGAFGGAKLVLKAASDELIKYIIVQETDGHLVKYTVHLPVREPIEGIEPSFWSMLGSLAFKK
ncbi:hypothetical protein [Fictibacillus sp. KU28468]|uniref:hypothetical protein n=1 Tax=Fictibacillus sp. KU28468 TaxID=2991053 RepID=UPI00223CF755|nr:hypothetical protein [Fictibacillus sp. KU28468]UZJ77483.1 hypothetical protein OKX00_15035 [Fictibacillus sp. KU28468]